MPKPHAPPPDSPAPPPTVAPHLGPVVEDEKNGRAHLAAAELGIVLSHYDLGVIQRIREYRRGSRRAPKLRISADRGEFLLKRRAPGHDDPGRVAFAQELQHHLEERGYPVPGLVRARSTHQTMLRLGPRVYEMFRFVSGSRDDRSAAAAREAGRALGRLHRLLLTHRTRAKPPPSSFHAHAGIDAGLRAIPAAVGAAEGSRHDDDLVRGCIFLRESYRDATRRAVATGLSAWPPRIIHGDWHPGNLLYVDGRIAAVLDFDSSRVEPRVMDIANAALQFGLEAPETDEPAGWPEHLSTARMGELLSGYDEGAGEAISAGERQALPWLMVEALILESVVPIAATGRFGQLSGRSFLAMVERKVRWLRREAKSLIERLG